MKNGDLIVKGSRADLLDIKAFTTAENMVDWEYASYDAYTHPRCERDGIDTIADLFGADFSKQFYAHKEYLIARSNLLDAENERNNAQIRVDALLLTIQEYERQQS